MGELSRFKGELGENIVEGFFQLIGWKSVSNFDINCLDHKKHRRKQHGIDYFSVYSSPLENDVAEVVLTSAKYLNNISEKEIQKEIVSLDNSMHCLQFQDLYNENLRKSYYKGKRHHLLFFCITDLDNQDTIKRALAEISKSQILVSSDITVVDSKRLEFVYTSIKYVKSLHINSDIDFFLSTNRFK